MNEEKRPEKKLFEVVVYPDGRISLCKGNSCQYVSKEFIEEMIEEIKAGQEVTRFVELTEPWQDVIEQLEGEEK